MTSPLTTPDCDLRGMLFMPLDVQRLLDSELFLVASGNEFKSAVALWCKSWSQVPAASLPDDDRVLAAYSGAGARWLKVKSVALRGWIKCDDGRLYHPVVAEKAHEAWSARLAQRSRTEAARAARAVSRSAVTLSVTNSVTDNVTGSKGQLRDSKGTVKGQGQMESAVPTPARSTPSPSPKDPLEGMDDQAQPARMVRDKNLGDLRVMHGKILIGNGERDDWDAVIAEFGFDLVDEACREIEKNLQPTHRVLLSVVTQWLANNTRKVKV